MSSEDKEHRRYLERTRAIKSQAAALDRIADQLETRNMIEMSKAPFAGASGVGYGWTQTGVTGAWNRVKARLGL